MARVEVPAEVRAFLSETIGSYEHLELLLLVCADRQCTWTPQTVAERSKLPSDTAAEALEHLLRHGLLTAETSNSGKVFTYSPATRHLDELVGALVQAYDANQLGIIELMSALAIERVRHRAVRLFADAFVLGRKRDKDG
jgi:hypothetical protein